MKMSLLAAVDLFVIMVGMLGFTVYAEDSQPSATSRPSDPNLPLGPELLKIPLSDLEQAYKGKTPPEGIRMYLAIQRGSRMGPGEGWFGPGQSRYSWDWLTKRSNASPEAGVTGAQFGGPAAWFQRLDRNLDGKITAEDLDWSERNSWVQNAYLVNRLFRKIDPTGDGKLTREEWLKFYDDLAGDRDGITPEDLRDAWLKGMSDNFLPGDAPTKEQLLNGLFAGEVGSLQDGPALDASAPDFQLKTWDGKQTVHLSEVIGTKPIVLCFGNFTCGPFRSMYPGVEAVARRFHDDAVFLAVYVREAHPTDGWQMVSNDRVGVKVAQPKTYAERTAVATQCRRLLHPTIPLLVDEIDDRTGHAYSGMPARLYVIDRQGKVAYKGGRGPFGFKTGELEQALIFTLLAGQGSERTPAASNAGAKQK